MFLSSESETFNPFGYTSKICSHLKKRRVTTNITKHDVFGRVFATTVKFLNSRHNWFSEKVSAIERCPLLRGLKYNSLTVA